MPAFNEAVRIRKVLSEIKKNNLKVVVVDDGSKDGTLQVSKKYTRFTLRHPINLGKGAALKTGCEAAFGLGAKAVILMDSDGQHKVADIPKFVKALRSYDVVFGKRDFGKVPFIRRLGNQVVPFCLNVLFGIQIKDVLCGFKALTRKAYNKIGWTSVGYSVETEIAAMTAKHKLNYCELPVSTVYYDKFKGLTPESGLEILFDLLLFKLR
jgi:glycosyltransferase involved in cell wall biosynthesis